MPSDLKNQIHALMETGLRPVSAETIMSRHRAESAPFPLTARTMGTRRRVITVTVGLAAAACAAALVTVQIAGPPGPRSAPTMLTAAYVRHVATASRLELARSFQAVVTSRQTGGVIQQETVDHITMSGANWNDAWTYLAVDGTGRPPHPDSGISRVVDGQAYDYGLATRWSEFKLLHGTGYAQGLAWYHLVGPHAATRLPIPDPRTLLAWLAPSARFVTTGRAVVSGMPVTALHATRLAGLPGISLPWFPTTFGQLTALEVWVDSHDVVQRIVLSVTRKATATSHNSVTYNSVNGKVSTESSAPPEVEITEPAPPGVTTVTVTFSAIGRPQVIRVPPNAIPVRPLVG